MVKVKSKNKEYLVSFSDEGKQKGSLNGSPFEWDIARIKDGSFHIIKKNKTFLAEVIKTDSGNKNITIKVNGNKYQLQVSDRYDELLKEMGFDISASVVIKDVKAPMPGLVLEVAVEAGQAVKTGDTLIVLEAMKMENILKSPADGIIKKVNVKKQDAVEKNAVLINFE